MENMPDNVKDNPAEKREALLAAPLAVYNMQEVWSFPLISCFSACWYASLLYL